MTGLHEGFDKRRIEALADGIFGIAMTLLVLDVNIALLMAISLLPFSAAVFAEPADPRFGVLAYCLNLLAISAAMYAQWSYATANGRLVKDTVGAEVIADVKRRIIGSTIALEAAILLALWDRWASFAVYIVVQIAYIIRTTRTPTGAPSH